MPSLADIYSFIDTQKRKAGNLIRSPVSTIQEMVALSNDEARDINRETALAAQGRKQQLIYGQQPTPEQTAASNALDQRLMDSMNIGGMTVWHGSPYKFSKFDSSKIGTGQGQQAYGHGLYVAENPNVAKGFQENLSSTAGSKRLASQFGGVDAGIKEAQRRVQHYEDLIKNGGGGDINRAQSFLKISQKNLNDLLAQKQGLPENKGVLYKIDLPDKHIAKMLDYEEEIKNQPKAVRELAKKLGISMDDTGFDLIEKVGRDKAGSDVLQAAGIPGIKYLDEMKREQGKKTRNFVVFDPNHLQILEHK